MGSGCGGQDVGSCFEVELWRRAVRSGCRSGCGVWL